MTYKRVTIREARKAIGAMDLDFLVDSGAFHTLVPRTTLLSLGIEPYKSVDIILADGTRITREVGDAYFELAGDGGVAPVIFGEAGEEPLLGATTLESFGLVLRARNKIKSCSDRLWRNIPSFSGENVLAGLRAKPPPRIFPFRPRSVTPRSVSPKHLILLRALNPLKRELYPVRLRQI